MPGEEDRPAQPRREQQHARDGRESVQARPGFRQAKPSMPGINVKSRLGNVKWLSIKRIAESWESRLRRRRISASL
jgi:hypothetical protein